ncbi:MAG: glutamyl-tRNA reductase, partial [Acidobacteria bacterium]|nr:glutamyl-tRNA reductase [Acidobacteriota bacterium]
PLDLRESLALDEAGVATALREISDRESVSEAVILATCNRTEIYVRVSDLEAGACAARQLFVARSGRRSGELDDHTYLMDGQEAARHLLRIAAGLDSMILGEHQILGQVRHAQTIARKAGTMGSLLDRLWSSAIHCGKRARSETDIGTGAVSVASAAVSLAERVFGELRNRAVMVVGAGETGRLAARQFADRTPSRLIVANRTAERSAAVAKSVGGEAASLDAIASLLSVVDVVVSATLAPGFVITHEMVQSAMATRPQRPLVLVDIAVPRDIDPAAARLEGVFLYPIDALKTLVDRSLARRMHEMPRVEAIVDDECRKFTTWTRGLRATPVVRELTEHFERMRAEEVRRSLRHFHPEEEAHIERLTKNLISRVLRGPITSMKSGAPSARADQEHLDMVRDLFALDSASKKGEVDGGNA